MSNLPKYNYSELPYPYAKYYISQDKLIERFNYIRQHMPKITYKQYTVMKLPKVKSHNLLYLPKSSQIPTGMIIDAKIRDMDNISEYFSDKVLVHAKRRDYKINQLQYWNKHKHRLVAKCRRLYKKVNPYNLVATLYTEHYGITTFRPSTFVATIRELYDDPTGINMLDMCAGWGDRLISAMSLNINYKGVDPHTRMHPIYQEIINFFRSMSTSNVTMICEPFESSNIGDDLYDIIYTCPPYFDFEMYSDEPTQSTQYKDLNDWYEFFLMTSLRKAWTYLKPNGYMAITLNDISNTEKYTWRMVEEINKWPDTAFFGTIAHSTKSPQPTWIWKKVSYKFDLSLIISDKTVHVENLTYAPTFIQYIPQQEVVYYTPDSSMLSICLACKQFSKKVTIFVISLNFDVIKAKTLGANIILLPDTPLDQLLLHATEYANKKSSAIVTYDQYVADLLQIFKFPATIWVLHNSHLATALSQFLNDSPVHSIQSLEEYQPKNDHINYLLDYSCRNYIKQ